MIEGKVAIFTQFKKWNPWWGIRDAWNLLRYDFKHRSKVLRIYLCLDPKSLGENKMYRLTHFVSKDEESSKVCIRIYGARIDEVKDEE